MVIIGGNTTLSIASMLSRKGLPVVGIPKTIDNDVREIDYTIGFQTAIQVATDALDRLRSTAEGHHRVMILEVMGRDTGWPPTPEWPTEQTLSSFLRFRQILGSFARC